MPCRQGHLSEGFPLQESHCNISILFSGHVPIDHRCLGDMQRFPVSGRMAGPLSLAIKVLRIQKTR